MPHDKKKSCSQKRFFFSSFDLHTRPRKTAGPDAMPAMHKDDEES